MTSSRSARKKPDFVRYQFPYVRFHGKSYPLIPITLEHGSYSVRTFALLDSGASVSVFRPEIADALHIKHRKSDAVRLGTANGGVDISVVKVRVRVEQTSFNAGIGFSEKYAATFNIIGREGFFRKFSIAFNEVMKTVILVPLENIK